MSSFTTPLVTEFIGPDQFRLVEPFEYHIGTYPSEQKVIVPVGFETDFGSIPKIFRWLLSPTGQWGKATVVHDYLCVHKIVTTPEGERIVSRKEADDIFNEAMTVLGVNKLARYAIYSAVRAYAIAMGKK